MSKTCVLKRFFSHGAKGCNRASVINMLVDLEVARNFEDMVGCLPCFP